MTKVKKTNETKAPAAATAQAVAWPAAKLAAEPSEAQDIDLQVILAAINETGDKLLAEVASYAVACRAAGTSPGTITFDDYRLRFSGDDLHSLTHK
jgi:hypothetical protein